MTTTAQDDWIRDQSLISPHDTVGSSATRFALELIAWSASPIAVHRLTGSLLVAGLALIVLVAAPALCNTPGDKRQEGPIETPGPVRLALEVFLWTVAVAAAAVVWPAPVAVAVALLTVIAAHSGAPRARWLLSGAPMPTAS